MSLDAHYLTTACWNSSCPWKMLISGREMTVFNSVHWRYQFNSLGQRVNNNSSNANWMDNLTWQSGSGGPAFVFSLPTLGFGKTETFLSLWFFHTFFKSSPEDTFIDFRERGNGGGRGRGERWEERGQERERENNIDQLPLVWALTGDWTHTPLMYGTMLQPSHPARALSS